MEKSLVIIIIKEFGIITNYEKLNNMVTLMRSLLTPVRQ